MSLGFANILDLDIYSRRISFFYKGKEKITSKFGFVLTVLYIIISIAIFLYYFIRTILREDVTASDSTIFSNEIPSIKIDSEIFNLAFGLEHPTKITRFIDETIYYPEAYYIVMKKKNGNFVSNLKQRIKTERCGNLNSGNKFLNLLDKNELNNSYCLIDYDNIALKGGFKYTEIGYIRINIYPCVNNSNNNNHCKPRETIDKFFNNSYFSILAKDTAINPNNFSHPGNPLLLNTYTTVNKLIKKDYIVKFAITEIDTDVGFFTKQIKKGKYLKYSKDFSEFSFSYTDYYIPNKEILSLSIRLEDNINLHKRTYKKMAEVFATTGGYMQLMYSIFAIISLLTKKMNIEKKLLNSLFYFNIKQKKVILSIEYKKKLNYVTSNTLIDKTNSDNNLNTKIMNLNNKNKNENINFIPYLAKKSPMIKKYSKVVKMEKNNRNEKINNELSRKSISFANLNNLKKLFNNRQNDASKDGLIEITKVQKNNMNEKTFIGNKKNNLNENNISKIFIRSKSNESENIKQFKKENFCNIDFNIFEYYCFSNITKKRRQIELFKLAYSFFQSQMDIINFFNIIVLTQIMMKKQSDEKHNYLSEVVELSM